jgi:eukaryotic-like serine/threonine-protein kinase
MTLADKWEQVQQVFLAVADLLPSEQAALLGEMCKGDPVLRTEVESLLRADTTSESVFASAFATAVKEEAASLLDSSKLEGSRIGPYRLIREIGRGGMGSVYLAARADEQYESNVAIKLVRAGLDTDFVLRRFRGERQILARLQHPNIGRLLDGGTTENEVPYLVMEYVHGSRITAYAAEHRLSVEKRIRLFLPVCSAVEYAHRAFIVHRDLKPGNILIDATGTPKLLDFGISKLLYCQASDAVDMPDVAMATPDYASPEQIMGDPVTPASDVYSLGAVLYELLTGARPHRIGQTTPLELERAICLNPVTHPSQAVRHDRLLARRLAGDLDAIILCAMRKDPEQRYASVERLARDLQCFLDQRPVSARADSFGYRTAKFIQRNRVPIALAGAVAAPVLGLGGFASYEAHISLRQSRQAIASQRDLERELAASYGRLGDMQGNTPAAVRSYSAMIEVTRTLWEADPSDPRSLADYGAAQLGLAMALPSEPRTEKRIALERAHAWLSEAVRQNATNAQLREQLNTASAALAALEEGKR